MIRKELRTWYYLGCRHSVGHHLTSRSGMTYHLPELSDLDGELCLEDKGLYQAVLTRLPHLDYSALAWWDQSIDHRRGSNSVIFAPSLTCPLETIRTAMTKWFPWVEARLPQPLIVVKQERIYHG